MDPLSAVASASALIFASIRVAKGLHDLREHYRSAGTMITSLTSECTILHVALSQIQRLALEDSFFVRLKSQPDLRDSLELALLSCAQTFSAMDEEIRELSKSQEQKDEIFLRLKYLWNEDKMGEILQQLRCQQNSLNLLLTTLQTCVIIIMSFIYTANTSVNSESISEIHQLLRSGNVLLERLAARSDELWSFQRKSSDDTASILNFSGSFSSDTKSTFEDGLRSSGVYRRISMANRRARETGQVSARLADEDLIDLGTDTEKGDPINQPYLEELRRNMVALSSLPVATVASQSLQDPPEEDVVTPNSESLHDSAEETRNDGPAGSIDEEDITSEQINGYLLLEYQRTAAKERLPVIRTSLSLEKLPDGWSIRSSPKGKPYYIDHFERYLFHAGPVLVNEEDNSRALPPGWVRVVTAAGRIRWTHQATGFVSHKHPYDNSRLFMYDFLGDWPFGKHGERRGTLKVYPRAFDYVGDDDGTCQMTADAFKTSPIQMKMQALAIALSESGSTRTRMEIAEKFRRALEDIQIRSDGKNI